jgi:bacteriocin biosynthesis cyclodehydratase domain-containing protein
MRTDTAARRYRRPRLKSTLDQLHGPGGTVYLLRPGAKDVAIRDPSPAQLRLFGRLRVAPPIDVLREEFGGPGGLPVDDVVAQLGALGLLEDAADDDVLADLDRERYDRQLAYFSEIGSAGTDRAAAQCALAAARVTVIGVGGLGSWISLGLACAGVGRLDVVDGDRVELSNLNRQVLYGTADLGRLKADAAREALARFNPGVACRAVPRRLESAADVAAAVDGADVVVGAADWPPLQIGHWINDACFAAGVPWVGASQFPPKVRVGPTYVPGRTGCLDCQEAAWRVAHPLLGAVAEQGALGAEVAASFGPACGLIGSLVAADVVHLLTGLAEPATTGRALLIDLRTMEVESEAVPRAAGCPTCGDCGAAPAA